LLIHDVSFVKADIFTTPNEDKCPSENTSFSD
jgi:hypothetical protein